jgi:HD-GYP domain-containing protein (c-di-GMP phosphodiesterase class II)
MDSRESTTKKESSEVLDKLTLLCSQGQELSSIGDTDTILDRVLEIATTMCQASAASILLVDRNTDELYFRAASGEAGPKVLKRRFKSDKGVAGWVVSNMEPVIANDVTHDPRHYGYIDTEVEFTTVNLICVPVIWKNKVVGVIEVLNKKDKQDFSVQDKEYLSILANQTAASLNITAMTDKLQNFYVNMLELLMMASETLASNPGHGVRVARLATKIAREVGVTDNEYKDIYYACLIHQIGQIRVARDQIIGGERMIPTLGAEMLRPIKLLKKIADIIECQREKWDGSGYPKGLKGEQIPQGSRIIGLAEEYEEWMEEEAYRKQFDPYYQDDFFKKIMKTHDPKVVHAFMEIRKKEREKQAAKAEQTSMQAV